MILELDDYIDSPTVDFIKKEIDEYKKGKVFSRYSGYNREGLTIHITPTPELKNLDEKLSFIFTQISQSIVRLKYNPMYAVGDSGYEYHCYDPGDVCSIHTDGEIVHNSSLLRVASVVVHLNTVENGGELVFPSQNKSIKTKKGKVVIFPPYGMYQHYTTPSDEKREVIVTWFVYNGIRISNI